MLQQIVPHQMLGRVFGLVSTAVYAGGALTYAGGGFLLDATSPRVTLALGGAGVLVCMVPLAVVLHREIRR